MTFKKGEPRAARAGRRAGTPNRATQTLQEIADSLGVNPFQILLYFAKGDYEALGLMKPSQKLYDENGEELNIEIPQISLELRQKSAKDACEYLYPKRKSIEVKDDTGKEEKFSFKLAYTTDEK